MYKILDIYCECAYHLSKQGIMQVLTKWNNTATTTDLQLFLEILIELGDKPLAVEFVQKGNADWLNGGIGKTLLVSTFNSLLCFINHL